MFKEILPLVTSSHSCGAHGSTEALSSTTVVGHMAVSHCWLPAKVMYPASSTKRFYWLTRSTPILLLMNIKIYMAVPRSYPLPQLWGIWLY